MEEILIISNYYPPEKGAAANRIEQLALKLHQNNYKVSVVCPLGNYPKGELFPQYKGKFSVTENLQNIRVKRLWIYPSNSKNILKRVFSILSFSFSLFFFLLFKKTPEKVVVQSPPLLLSFISVFALSFKRKKIILNVSDLWPLAAVELGVMHKGSFSHKISSLLERYIYKKSTLVLGQSNEIIAHVRSLFPNKECFLYRNFPEHQVTKLELDLKEKEPIKIFYAGLLGVAQGVLGMCEKMELEHLNIEFHVFGDGPEKAKIESLISAQKNPKIFFHGMLDRNTLHEKLKSFDIAFVPLKTRIYGSVPSKIFEYCSLGFPIIYFGGGEGETIVENNDLGWVVKIKQYDDLNSLLKAIGTIQKPDTLPMRNRIFNECRENFDLDKQLEELIEKEVF